MVRKRTVTLGEEYDRLDDRADELATLAADAENQQAYRQTYNEIMVQGQAVGWLINGDPEGDGDFDGYGRAPSVVVRGLTADQRARVFNRVEELKRVRDQQHLPGSHDVVYAGTGLIAAPFFDPDDGGVPHPDDPDVTTSERNDAAIAAVRAQPPGVQKWLYALVDDLTTVSGGNWTSFNERIAASRSDSTASKNSDTQSES